MPTALADPALAAVRACDESVRAAEVARLLAVLDWVATHTVDGGETVTFGDRPLPLGGEGCPLVAEFAAYDLAAALGTTTDSGLALLARAVELRHRLPRLFAAVVDGSVPVWKAGRVADATMALPAEGAGWVDDRLAGTVARVSFAQVGRLVDEALARFDPEEARRRAEATADGRHVHLDLSRPTLDGSVAVDGLLSLPDALDLDDALRTGAAALADAGCDAPLDVRRSLALGELARGDAALPLATSRSRDLVVHLHHDSPDVGRDQTSRSPISVDTVREWCATNPFTRVVVKPVLDLAAHVHVDAYEAPDRLREQVVLRDVSCVFPHCTRPAHGCDLDHVVPWETSRTTSTDNLAPLCRRHHRAKTHGRWRYVVVGPGSFHWTAPSGLTYRRDHRGTVPLEPPAT